MWAYKYLDKSLHYHWRKNINQNIYELTPSLSQTSQKNRLLSVPDQRRAQDFSVLKVCF
jgi:hypothetical protein